MLSGAPTAASSNFTTIIFFVFFSVLLFLIHQLLFSIFIRFRCRITIWSYCITTISFIFYMLHYFFMRWFIFFFFFSILCLL